MINEKVLNTIIKDVYWSYEECGNKVPQEIKTSLAKIKVLVHKSTPKFIVDYITHFACPVCKCIIETNFNYCPYCSQALKKWSDENDK